ncbi:MAG: bifunctional isocitrate dehydrogenase kinase/phosphatase [Actinomycetota bacterium]
MTEPLLVLDDVSFTWGSSFSLRGISLRIDPDDRLAIVGSNGAGKSTLAKVIAGALTPSAGEISGSCRRPEDVGSALDLRLGTPGRTVRDAITHELSSGLVDEVLTSVSLEVALADRRLTDISGGERYRLAVAIELARRPPLLVLDAPTAALDTRSTRALLRALDRYPGAIVVLSADLSLAVEACHRVVLLDDGHIAARGTPAELLTDAELLRWHGLQMPSGMSPSWLRRRARRRQDGASPEGSADAASWARSARPNNAELAAEIAVRIEQAFVGFHNEFKSITRRAARRFGQLDFEAHQTDTAERLRLHRRCVEDCVKFVKPLVTLHPQEDRRGIWTQARLNYAQSIAWRPDSELAETFFNSVTRRVFTMVGVDDDLEFRWFGGIALPVVDPGQGEVVTFRRRGTTGELMESILASYELRGRWVDRAGDAAKIARAVDRHLSQTWEAAMPVEVDMLAPVFYRNRGAYLVGRIRHLNRVSPLVVALVSRPEGIEADAVLLDELLTSRIFGFTRSYFHVDTEEPGAIVAFIKSILPLKPVAELYTSIGHSGHGKTSLFRAIYRHLDNSTDRFVAARGVKGMVMNVFTLPSFGVVFKTIKDTFPPSKRTSRQQIREKYNLVFQHDRVGRMVDAQVFENLAFPRDRFTDELLEELLAESGETVHVVGDQVILDHVYTERRMYPLDLYLREMPVAQARSAVIDYGKAIKDLCAANIFPGDLFTKNFGVTRHGSVVFYDYDELAFLEQMNFRDIPEARSYEDEISDQPWFSIGVDDVFPEEFRKFFRFPEAVRSAFDEHHADLYTADAWRAMQDRHRETSMPEFFPYPADARL